MKYNRPNIIDVIEAFLTGISCLIGGDQFYIFISQTNASIKTQYCILTIISILVFMSFAVLDHHKDILFNGSYLIYAVLTGILVLISYNRVKSPFFISFMTSLIAIVLTFFIIQACAKYSKRKYLLPSFITGLFAARLIPNLCWIWMRKQFDDYETQQYYVSLIVSLFRFSMCLKVILIKVITKNFDVDYKFSGVELKWPEGEFSTAAYSIWSSFLEIKINVPPYVLFISSLVIYLTFPPTIYLSYFTYSSQLVSALSTIEMALHLLGLGVGTMVPFSKTSNYYHYYSIVFVIFLVYFCSMGIIYHLGKNYSHYVLYTIVIISSFLLGYLCTYSLSIIINTTFLQTCQHEEYGSSPCCGDKINNKCYCRLQSIADSNKTKEKIFDCSTLACCTGKKTPKYSSDAKHAIVILPDCKLTSNLPTCSETCSGGTTCCSSVGQNCCLKLIGCFLLESTTTSSCEDCQLTVRLEAKPICSKQQCGSDTGSNCCTCVNGPSKKCGCICSNCTKTCGANCRCFKFCCSTTTTCSCGQNGETARVFIAINNDNKCCIREIKPNATFDYIGDQNDSSDFDIRDLFISDCCHTNLTVDLHCTKKNNFYRLTGVDYKNKLNQPKSLKLSRKDGKCCNGQPQQCCCADAQLVKLSVTYPGSQSSGSTETTTNSCCSGNCAQACQCCQPSVPGKCCCCLVCDLNVDCLTSYCKKVDTTRIKLICVSMFYIAFFSFVLVLLVFWMRAGSIPPYKFKPKIKFDKIKKATTKNKFNTDAVVGTRITNILKELKANHIKEEDVANMLTVMGKVMKKDEFEKMKKHLNKEAAKFVKSSKDEKFKKTETVKWCYCTGLIYGYFLSIFKKFQKFFAYWEKAWQNEFFDYRKLLSSIINSISQKSKFAISVMTELDLTELEVYKKSKDRIVTWDDVFGELDKYAELYAGELRFSTTWLPFRLDDRLFQYLDRWHHRLTHIYEWTQDEKSVFDWKPFLYYFDLYEQWYRDFSTYLVRFSDDITIPPKVLNKETEVFVNYKLK